MSGPSVVFEAIAKQLVKFLSCQVNSRNIRFIPLDNGVGTCLLAAECCHRDILNPTGVIVASAQKTFYIETFGCQMNFHDSEKVVGTLISEGYAQVQREEEADLIVYNTCSIRDKAEQKVFHRLADFKALKAKG